MTRRFFAYDWPGNIRQLRNIVESMVVLDMDGILDVDDLPPDFEVSNDELPTNSLGASRFGRTANGSDRKMGLSTNLGTY